MIRKFTNTVTRFDSCVQCQRNSVLEKRIRSWGKAFERIIQKRNFKSSLVEQYSQNARAVLILPECAFHQETHSARPGAKD